MIKKYRWYIYIWFMQLYLICVWFYMSLLDLHLVLYDFIWFYMILWAETKIHLFSIVFVSLFIYICIYLFIYLCIFYIFPTTYNHKWRLLKWPSPPPPACMKVIKIIEFNNIHAFPILITFIWGYVLRFLRCVFTFYFILFYLIMLF